MTSARALALTALVLAAVACTQATTTSAPPTDTVALPTPNVTIEADPPPPFTYWAPEGAVIRNHGNPGLWVAFVDGRNVATYFGDQCRASEYQRYVGQPLTAMAAPPEGVELRTSCETCPVNGDLRPNRMNVLFDEATQRITKIACY